MVRIAGLILVVGIAVGVWVAVKEYRQPRKDSEREFIPEIQQKAEQYFPASDAEPIVTEHDGITEVSLSEPPKVTVQSSVEEVKEYRQKSVELEKQAEEIKKTGGASQLVANIGTASVMVDPLYTYEAQRTGLIGRERLGENEGTLYVFQMDDPGRLFGTKGMTFPIDIIWINSAKQVVHIHKNVPPDYNGDLKSLWPSRYVLEVNAGYVDTYGIKTGDKLDLKKIPN